MSRTISDARPNSFHGFDSPASSAIASSTISVALIQLQMRVYSAFEIASGAASVTTRVLSALKKEDVAISVAKKNQPGQINEVKQFAQASAGLTKQFVYVRTGVPLSKAASSVLPDAELVSNEKQDGKIEHFYFLELVYDVILREPLEAAKLKFLWPVRVVFEPGHFRVHITLMEKNVRSYFPLERKAISDGRNLSEEDIIFKICETLKIDPLASALDLNKGIKAMWEIDLIDSLTARWKEPKDTTTKTMDKDCLLKRDNPQAYKGLIKAPLLKTAFAFLEESDKFPSHFWSDPTLGQVTIPIFSENESIAENVIREILKHN